MARVLKRRALRSRFALALLITSIVEHTYTLWRAREIILGLRNGFVR